MGARTFGILVDKVMQERGLTQARLAVLVGVLPDGRVLNETQVRRIREGQRRLDPELIRRLVEVLGLDEGEAWHAAGMWPPGLSLAGYRQFRQHALAHGEKVIGWYPVPAGHGPVLVPVPDDLGELIEPLRHPRDRRLKPQPPAILKVFEVAA